MKIRNESDYIKKILRPYLEELGFKVHKHTERFSSGFPDITAVKDGYTIYIEAKIGKAQPTALQMKELTELAQHGARCYVFTFLIADEMEKIIPVAADGTVRAIGRDIFEIQWR